MSDEPETNAGVEADADADADAETNAAETEAEADAEGEIADGPLAEARAAFDAGDFAQVRKLTAKLADSDEPETTRAALELRRKVAIDPAQIAVLVLCAGFFVWICSKYVF